MAGLRCGLRRTGVQRRGFRRQPGSHHGRQNRHGRQGAGEIVRRQAQLASVCRQRILIPRRMRHGMRTSEQLGADENGYEKEVAELTHG